MDNSENMVIKRGEVYWVQNDILGIDGRLGRPVVVISNNRGNESADHIIGLFTTTKTKYGVLNVELNSPNKTMWVQCNYPITVRKGHLCNYLYTLTDDEMAAVERGVKYALSLTSESVVDYEDEKRELEEEIASLRTRVTDKKDDDTGVAVERDMYKRMYEKAVEMLAEAKMGTPAPEPEAKPTAVPVYEAAVVESKKPEPEVKVEPTPEKFDVNTCSEADLRNCGCTPTMIKYIIEKRPYKKLAELKALPNMTRIAYQILAPKLCCNPAPKAKKSTKVNVNTATVEELVEKVGLNVVTAQMIRAYRNKNGPFELLEDLTKVSRFGPKCLVKYGPMLEV